MKALDAVLATLPPEAQLRIHIAAEVDIIQELERRHAYTQVLLRMVNLARLLGIIGWAESIETLPVDDFNARFDRYIEGLERD